MDVKGISHSPAQMFAVVIGAGYLFSGVVGLAQGGTGSTEVFGVLGVNFLHNLIHIVVFGAIWIAAGLSGPVIAKLGNLALGVALWLVCLLGLIGWLGWLDIESGFAEPHFWLTLFTGAIAVFFGTVGAELPHRAKVVA